MSNTNTNALSVSVDPSNSVGMPEIPLAVSVKGATIVGLDAAGKTKRFEMEKIMRPANDFITATSKPTGDRYAGESWPVKGPYPVTLPFFGNLTIPEKVGEKIVSNAKIYWNEGVFTPDWTLLEVPLLDSYAKKNVVDRLQADVGSVLGIGMTGRVGYNTYADHASLADTGLYLHRGKYIEADGTVTRLTAYISAIGNFDVVLLRPNTDNVYVEISRVTLNNPVGLSLQEFALNIPVLKNDTLGIVALSTPRPRTTALTGASFIKYAGLSAWVNVPVATIQTFGTENRALEFDFFYDKSPAVIDDLETRVTKVENDVLEILDLLEPDTEEKVLGYSAMTPNATTTAGSFWVHGGGKVITGNGVAKKLKIILNAAGSNILIHYRLVNGRYQEASRINVTVPTAMVVNDIPINFNVQKNDTFAVRSIPGGNGARVRTTALGGSSHFFLTSDADVAAGFTPAQIVAGNSAGLALSFDIICDILVEDEQQGAMLTEISLAGSSDLGVLDFQGFDTDYSINFINGQSLSEGEQSYIPLTTEAVPGCSMVGTQIWEYQNSSSTAIVPLVNKASGTKAENSIVAAVHSFKALFDRYNPRSGKVHFLASCVGLGGRSIERLSKESTNGENYYNSLFISALNRAKAAVAALATGKSISCSYIVFMQGENNYQGLAGQGLTSGTAATNDKTVYKALLLALKNNMQNDVISTLGQTKKPLFLIYQTSGTYLSADLPNKEMSPITQAQLEFAQENEDVILLNPHYQMPEYNQGHLTANGYRWFGEQMAKTLHNVFNKGIRFKPVTPTGLKVVGSTVVIDLYVPVAPLVFDNYTTDQQLYNGFKVRVNGNEVSLETKISGNQIILTAPTDLKGLIEVSYAAFGRNGAGNVRDSDTWRSKYSFVDDSNNALILTPIRIVPKDKNGVALYGKPYPCYNWLSSFYYSLNV